ncbi:MAG TPA: hypothetical protein VGO67_07940 [Verrucomicrobiae bacterium]
MKSRLTALLFSFAIASLAAASQDSLPLRVASISSAAIQPAQSDPAVIFYDDFSAPPTVASERYLEYTSADGSFVWEPDGGLSGGSMKCQFAKGQVTAGTLKVLFGRSPFNRGIRRNETFNEIYWRVYVKHESGWEGNPAKLARATCLASENWTQGMIAHVWGGKGAMLCIDPATGIRDSVKVSTRYNDFDHLKWLGSRNGHTPIFSPAESGRWVCVESHIKLNKPGLSDGIFELWVDGHLEASRTNLDWHGTWSDYAINAVFLENYWNDGSVKKQARWFDNFVISTHSIGPLVASSPPMLERTPGNLSTGWELEIAADPEGADIVWRSKPISAKEMRVTVDSANGEFTGSQNGKTALVAAHDYWSRIRRVGEKEWSPWHAPFRQ